MLEFLVGSLFDPFDMLSAVRDWRRERRTQRRVRSTMVPGALRVVDGTHPGLGRRWTRGAARVPPGNLVFRPDSGWRAELTIPVHSVTLQAPDDLRRRTSRARGPRTRSILVETAHAVLEWSVPEDQVQRSMTVTRPSVRATRPPTG